MAKVSVIIPAYACAPYIARTLESLQKQSFSDWEAIVVDDGSPDNVADVVAPYVERDSRIRFIHSSNHGVSAARNIGVRESSGEFILPLDGDDIIAPKYIEECLKGFERFEDAAVVYSRWAFFGASTDAVDLRYFSYDHELVRNAIFNCAMFRRKDFDFIGGYDENMRDGLEDWEFWIRMLNPEKFRSKGERRVVQLRDVLFFYRQKGVGHNPRVGETRLMKALDYIYTKHSDIYRSRFGHPILMAQRFATEYQVLRNEVRDSRLKERWRIAVSKRALRDRLERLGSEEGE